MSSRLSGRVAVITGGARGIGATIAKRFRNEGAATLVFDQGLEDGGHEDDRAISLRGDVTNEKDITHLVNVAKDRFGKIDIVVNNAAVLQHLTTKSFREVDLDDWDNILRVNLRGAFQVTREVVPLMEVAEYGRIINIGSSTAFMGAPIAPYAASKAGLIALTQSLARELGASGITANAIALGLIEGPSLEEQPSQAIAGARATLMAMKAIKRNQGPESVADAAVFLASDESEFITGQTLMLDGGAVMR